MNDVLASLARLAEQVADIEQRLSMAVVTQRAEVADGSGTVRASIDVLSDIEAQRLHPFPMPPLPGGGPATCSLMDGDGMIRLNLTAHGRPGAPSLGLLGEGEAYCELLAATEATGNPLALLVPSGDAPYVAAGTDADSDCIGIHLSSKDRRKLAELIIDTCGEPRLVLLGAGRRE